MNIRTTLKCAAVAAILFAQPVKATWTTNETEQFWAIVAENATLVSTSRRQYKADLEKGEAIIEMFGKEKMPNAFTFYHKSREKALEKEKALKENFPNGVESDPSGGRLFEKISKTASKAISEYFRRRDELCYFYLLNKAGIMSDRGLSYTDQSKVCIMLPPVGYSPRRIPKSRSLKEDELAFARRHMQETSAAYERLKEAFESGHREFESLYDEALMLDAVRVEATLAPLACRLEEISSRIKEMVKVTREKKILYAVDEISDEELKAFDKGFAKDIQEFEETLPVATYSKEWQAKNWTEKEWAHIAYREGAPLLGLQLVMIDIPGRNYSVCAYEVTQALWKSVMGKEPTLPKYNSYEYLATEFKGDNRPVEIFFSNDCTLFLEKLNRLFGTGDSGRPYRLPTYAEWMYACQAGAKGPFCKTQDGNEIMEGTLGEVAWCEANSEKQKTHPVGQKKPNLFGLYDMFGNMPELVEKLEPNLNGAGTTLKYLYCGGGWNRGPYALRDEQGDDASFRWTWSDKNGASFEITGLRLVR